MVLADGFIPICFQKQQYNPRLQAIESEADRLKQQYQRTVSDLQQEIASLQEQLRRSKAEHKAASIQVSELRKTLEGMRKQLYIQEQDKLKTSGDRELAAHRASSLAKKSTDLEGRYAADSLAEVLHTGLVQL